MMTWWTWAAQRSRASRLLLATLFALVAVTTAILAFVVGNAGALATDAARAALTSAEPGAGAVQAQTRIGADPAAQDASARSKLAEGFAPAPVSIHTTYVSEPRKVDGVEPRLTLWAGEHLSPGLLDVTDGDWPVSPQEAALHADAAAALGIAPGATLTVDGHALTVTALWEAAESSHPLWFGDPLITDGADAVSVGPLIVDRSVLTGGDPFLRWSVIPNAERITPEQLAVLADGAERAKALVAEADLTGRGIVVEGSLSSTAERAARDWSVGRSFGTVPVSVLLLVAAVGLVQVSGLLAATRQREHELLAARGASRRQLIITGVGEATVVAVAGAVLGTGIAAGALGLLTGNTSQLGVVLLGGAGSLLLALLCLWVVTVRSTSALTGRPRADRVRAVAGAAALVIVFAAAALTTWQLQRSESLEPALSPAFLLAASAVVGLVAFGPLTRLIEAFTARGGTAIWLAGAQLARGLVVHAVPVTLTILATGTTTLASFYAGTAAATHRDLTALAAGAEVRVSLSSQDAAQGTIPPSAVPVWFDEAARVGDTPVTALAAPLGSLAGVTRLPAGLALPQLPERPAQVAPLDLPAGADTLSFSLAGEVYLDQWQQERYERIEEFNRVAAEGLPPEEAEELVRIWTADYYVTIQQETTYTSSLALRDTRTGLSSTVRGPSVTIGELGVTASSTVEVPLPSQGDLVLDAVHLTGPNAGFVDRTTRLEITLAADGVPLGGAEEWSSDIAVPYAHSGSYRAALAAVEPQWEVRHDVIDTGAGTTQTRSFYQSNRPPLPQAFLDARGDTWLIDAHPAPESLTVGPNVAFSGHDPDGALPRAQPSPPVPIAITAALAEATTLGVGGTLDLAAFGRRIPAQIAAITDVVPGTTDALGVLADSRAIASYLAATFEPLRPPSELWSNLDGDAAEPAPARTATAARSLWIAAGSALLLSLTGLAAAAASQLGARRSEVAVLRALGMTPREQGRSRAWETGGVLAVATVAGLGAGWLVSWLAVPSIVSAAADEGVSFRSTLTPELLPWAALLACGAVAVSAILWLLARAVRVQALDAEYREEVR